jgi:autotransporter-associated beta strand protein
MKRSQLFCSSVLIGISWFIYFTPNAAGQLLVSDRVSNQILEYNLDGTFRGILVLPSYPTLSTPAAMAFDNGSDLFVTSQSAGTVLRYNWKTGEYLGVFASGLYGPSGLLFDGANNRLYVSEFGNFDGQAIVCYNAASGAEITRFGYGAGGAARGDMAMGSDGKLYVSDWYDGQIMRFDPANNYSAEVFAGSVGLWGSNGLVFDPSGNLDVVGMMSNNVYQFNGSGTAIGELVPASSGGLLFPSDIVIDPDGYLLVSSMGDDKADPPISGYIGKYNLSTGAAINSGFITFTGSTLVQPTALLVEPAAWTGGGSSTGWKNSANWRGTPPTYQAPMCFGAIETGAHASNNNNYDPGTQFYGITFTSDAPQYVLQGNAIKLGGPVVNQSANDQEIDLDMELVLGGGSFDTGDRNITVAGLISGDQSLTKKGAGTLLVTGELSYTGSTKVIEGTLDIDGPLTCSPIVTVEGEGAELLAQSIVADTLTIGAGAMVVIKPIPGGPNAETDLKTLPEPGMMALLITAGALVPLVFQSWRRKT